MTYINKNDTWDCTIHMVAGIPRGQNCHVCKGEMMEGLGERGTLGGQEYSVDNLFTGDDIPKEPTKKPRKKQEDSGGSCDYYKLEAYSVGLGKTQTVECKDIMHELGLNHAEMNMFKEIWRTAAARKGKKKKGHTPLRGAEKIKFFADENLALVKAGR